MLPVIIYAPQYAERSNIMTMLTRYAEENGFRFSVLENTSDVQEAIAALKQHPEITLSFVGITPTEGASERALSLGSCALQQNRDNYVVYCPARGSEMRSLITDCVRPTGFLLAAFDEKRFDRVMDWIASDYERIAQDTQEDFLSLQNGASVFRIPVSTIDFIEALDKKLNVWTNRQCITVYERLGKMEETLGQRFFRCHRSYLVQSSRIKKIDYEKMELLLLNGNRLPLSRSAKDRLKEMLSTEVGAQ